MSFADHQVGMDSVGTCGCFCILESDMFQAPRKVSLMRLCVVAHRNRRNERMLHSTIIASETLRVIPLPH